MFMVFVMHSRLSYIHCLFREVSRVVSVLKPLKQVYTNMPCVHPFICPGMRSLSCMNLSDMNCVSDVLIRDTFCMVVLDSMWLMHTSYRSRQYRNMSAGVLLCMGVVMASSTE